MKQALKFLLIFFSITIFVLGAGGYYVVRLLSLELESKFYNAEDSVPTKVYSRIIWLRPTNLVSLKELFIRLQERSYLEVNNEQALVQGSYFVENKSNEEKKIYIFLRNFLYPASIEKIFFNEQEIGVEKKNHFIVYWKEGEIRKIVQVQQNEEREIKALALEPVLIAQLNRNDKETRKTVPLQEIPHTLLQAIVSVEDQRFLEHGGIDPKGILRSFLVNLRAGEYQQGASTITQQMVRNIYLTRSKTIRRKIKEMVMAVLIELNYSKDQILEKYLNEVYLGQLGSLEIHGVSQGAKYYFGKNLEKISIAEQALLAALVRGPQYYSPYKHYERVKQRQELILQKMVDSGVITEDQYKDSLKEKLVFIESTNVLDKVPYFTDFIKARLAKDLPDEEFLGRGFQVYSTLDTYYQKLVEVEVSKGVTAIEANLQKNLDRAKKSKKNKFELEKTVPLQGAFILLDPSTSQVLAIVGGKSYQESNYNRALYMQRQIGSIVKPFVFLTALLHGKDEHGGLLNAASLLEDSPFTYKYDDKVWEPKNYEPGYEGKVSMRKALSHSLNIPTVRLAVSVGIDKVVEVLNKAGVSNEIKALPSLALGAVEIPPLQIAQSYSTLANFGVRKEVATIIAVTNSEGEPVIVRMPAEDEVFPPAETANLVEMMRTVFVDGTAKFAKDLGFHYPAAGKTGTTNDYRDSWFAGFTQKFLGVAWIGYDKEDGVAQKQRTFQKLTGATGALPIWAQVMRQLHEGIPQKDLNIPEGLLEKIQIDSRNGGRMNPKCTNAIKVEEYFTNKNIPNFDCLDD